jgi:hypothetical protein
VAWSVIAGQGDAGADRQGGSGDGNSDHKAAPTGADVPAAHDMEEVRFGVEICRGSRESAAQQGSEVVVS